ncbi:MAG: amino acid adenylation domain-containing protein [Vicinamibacteria bacterium]
MSQAYIAPASYQQRQMWALDRLIANPAAYGEAWTARVRGALDLDVLERALAAIVDRHDTLRTTFELVDGELMQRVGPTGTFALARDDVSGHPFVEREAEARRIVARVVSAPVDLIAGPILRAHAIALAHDEHWLIVASHHIVFDRWSASIFARELALAYEAFAAGAAPAWDELPVQYADYAEWQRERLDGGLMETQVAYWREALAGVAPLELPIDRLRPAQASHRGGEVAFAIDAATAAKLQALARRHEASLFMVLLAAFEAFVHRWSGQTDIAVAVPVAGRSRPELEGMIGYFANVVVMRGDASDDPTFEAFLTAVRADALAALDHADLPFEKLVERLAPRRDAGRNPLAQASFRLRNTPPTAIRLPGLDVERLDALHPAAAKFDLAMTIEDVGGALVGCIEYATDLFDAATVERAGEQWRTLVRAIADDPSRPLSRLPMQDASARAQQIARGREGERPYPHDVGVHRLVEAVARATPDAIAIVDGDHVATYAELDTRANRLAHALVRRVATPGARIGLAFERGAAMVVAMLATLKAGHAYVPLDVEWPAARRDAIAADAGLALTLGPGDVTTIGAESTAPLDRDPADPGGAPAYVIYTSGSTGAPKGVEVPHRAITRLVRDTDYLQVIASDVVANAAHPAFDATTFEVFGALANGARLVVVPRLTALAPRALAQALRANAVSVLFLTTSLFHEVARSTPDAFAGLRAVLFGGELADPRLVREVCEAGKPRRLLHVYGPTETTTFATRHAVDAVPDDCAAVPIGRPIANTTALVLDDRLEPVPDGLPGDLWLGGPGLALGYVGAPQLTAERFVPHPFDPTPGARLYRTGDRVRVDARGDLVYLGRRDRQVKIRGQRIELDEIEQALARLPEIREAAVVAVGAGSDARRIVAYAVPSNPNAPPPANLRRDLKRVLPDVMLPSSVVWMRALPLNDSGKVDRRALPPPPDDAPARPADAKVLPRDMLEQVIAGHWERLLGRAPIGIDEHFFEIGGHSLLAARLMDEIEKASGIALPLAALFADDTVAGLAERLRRRVENDEAPLVVLHPDGARPPLVLLHGDLTGGGFYSRALARHLGPDQPMLVVHPHTLLTGAIPPTIAAMAEDRVRALRKVRPHGPYVLAGYCNGAYVAFEMARQLVAAGDDVPVCVLLEAHPPSGDAETEDAGYLLLDASGAPRMLAAVDHQSEMHLAYRRAMDAYEGGPYDGVLVTINSHDVLADAEAGWHRLAPKLEWHRIAETHVRIVTHRTAEMAAVIGAAIDRVVAGAVSARSGASGTDRPVASA